MAAVIIDFKKDWMKFVDTEMTKMGFQYDAQKSLEENTLTYFSCKRRIVDSKPRRVHESEELLVPDERAEAYASIKSLISVGGDIRPYLSRKSKNPQYNDLLLNDWGIHHVHFSPEGTKDVLFVMFTDTDAFILQVLPHGHTDEETWVNTSLIEILHKNWPESIANRRIRGVSGEDISRRERLNIRKAHGNTVVKVSDGTCYIAPGGGITGSGICVSDVMACDKLVEDLASWEELAKANETSFRNALKISESDPLAIRLMFEESECWLYEPNRGVRFQLELSR